MISLHAEIQRLSEAFAAKIVHAIRGLTLDDLARLDGTPGSSPSPRSRTRHRRAPEAQQHVADQIVAIVQTHPNGINAEGLKAKLGIKTGPKAAPTFMRPLAVALASKQIRKRGQKRGTTYHAS